MRTRARDTVVKVHTGQQRLRMKVSGTEATLSQGSYINVTTDASYMEDTTGDHVHTNYCLHKRAIISSPRRIDVATLYKQGANENDWYYIISPQGMTQPEMAGQPTVTQSVSQSQASKMMVEGSLSGSVLAPVFLKELPEGKQTWNSLKEKGFGAKKFANKFLAYKFGILPFIGDLGKLRGFHGAIQKHVNFINRSYRTIITRDTTCGSLSGFERYLYPTSKSGYELKETHWEGSVKAKCRLLVVRQYQRQDIVNAYVDLYGGNILSNAWEMIPYSFVVDWFFSVGDVISQLQPKLQVPCCVPLDGCSVIKATLIRPSLVWDDLTNGAKLIGTSTTTYFRRTSGVGSLTPSFMGEGLTFSRALVAGALAIQKV